MSVTKIKTPTDILEFGEKMVRMPYETPTFVSGLETGLLIAQQRPDVAAELLNVMNQPVAGIPMRTDLTSELDALGVKND